MRRKCIIDIYEHHIQKRNEIVYLYNMDETVCKVYSHNDRTYYLTWRDVLIAAGEENFFRQLGLARFEGLSPMQCYIGASTSSHLRKIGR